MRSRMLLAAMVCGASAAAAQSPDSPVRHLKYEVDYVLNADGTHAETRHREVKVLKESALARIKQHTVTYSTSVQRAEVLEAYTLKADGRRVDAPKDNYQVEVNSGREKGAPAFSDYSTLTVIFPDVAVGDTVVLTNRITQTEAIFPGQFSTVETLARAQAVDAARIRVDAPAGLPLRFHAQDLQESPPVERDGRVVRQWTFANATPAKSKRRDWSVYELKDEPGLIVSTFTSHQAIADAYGQRALPRAAVTRRIQALADSITRDASGREAQARALYDWVATEITYAGNCVGAGAVVPREVNFVLDNKMGDCKDHATLLQALLAAKGIRSTQALVNAGSSYSLPALPVVSMVNHVINYLPDLDLYADSTSSETPFGTLPFADADKPVLLVDGSKAAARTPPIPAGSNRQVMKSEMWIEADGAVRGEIAFEQKGLFAITSRAGFRAMTEEQKEQWLKSMYTNEGQEGSGAIENEDPKPLRDSYRFKVKYKMPQAVQLPGPGAFAVVPYFYTDGVIPTMLASATQPAEEVATACTSGYSEEHYVIHFPDGMKVTAVPRNSAAKGEIAAYEASYSRKGNVLTVKRVFDDRTPGHVCTPKTIAEFRRVALKALQDVKAQVVYQ